MKRNYAWIAFVCLLVLTPVLAAQEAPSESKLDFSGRYLILSTNRWSTLNQELKQALAAGYGVLMGDAPFKFLVLEKQPQGAPQREFKVVENLSRDLEGAAAEGFRLMPATVGMKVKNIAGVAGKTADSSTRFEYRVLNPIRTSSLQKDITEAAGQGYRPVAFAAAERHAVIMERPVGQAAEAQPETTTSAPVYLLLATNKSSTLKKELEAAVKDGYRVLFGAGGKENFLLLEKRPDGTPAPEYLLVATTKSGTLEEEINQAASRGFRVLPSTLAAVQKRASILGTYGFEVTLIMEKVVGTAPPPTYLVIGTNRVGTFQKELAEAEQNNFELVRMTVGYREKVAILTKTASK